MVALHERVLLLVCLIFLLAACGREDAVRIGFIGGVTGRVADLGIAGRNGVQLAVDEVNRSGGIRGQKVELIIGDDQQDADVATKVMNSLLDRKVSVVIGPMTSAMAMAVVPQANRAGVTMISPTVTTKRLTGLDDQFVRVISSTDAYARVSAENHYKRKQLRRMVLAYDARNRAYTEDWLNDYRDAFKTMGGEVLATIEFSSTDETRFAGVATEALQFRPDGVLVLANSIDASLLLQQIRKRNSKVAIAISEWGATERLIEMAGPAAEGLLAAQFFDRQSLRSEYVAFRRAYLERFGLEPGFSGVAAYEAAAIALEALARKERDQPLKNYLLAKGRFPGLQSEIEIDRFGESKRATYLTVVKQGQFVRDE